jgi:hypothetical protein
MRVARILITMCCAFVIATVLLVTGARADEYTKLTYLTFSAPVQVPGMTLPAGTYMFKLADPDSGRRAIQIWDEQGTKLFTMLLTIPDEQPEAQDEPVVMFSERPSGSAPAVKSWFYPAERTGYEFIYPREQAMKIASDAKAPVLAYNTDVKSDADEAALRGTEVGRIDERGQAAADDPAATATATATTASAASPSAQASTASGSANPPTTTAAAAPSNAEPPSANRSSAPAAAPTTATASGAAAAGPTGVGTSGQADRPAQAPSSAQPAQRAQELPRTASPLTALQLLSAGLIVSALGLRQVRRRSAANR